MASKRAVSKRDQQGTGVVMGKFDTFFIHGGNLAPSSMRAEDDGPNMGFTTGCAVKHGQSDFSEEACNSISTHLERKRRTLSFRICNQLIDEDAQHDCAQRPCYNRMSDDLT